MLTEKILFYVFASILLFAGTMVITTKNTVRSALFLVLAFFSSAAIWLLLEAEFLAVILVLVYVGAVMVLFLFVIMMLNIKESSLREGFTNFLPIGILVSVAVVIQMCLVVSHKYFGLEQFASPERATAEHSNIEMLGELLYTKYVFQFEVAAVILLVAIIAAITLTFRGRRMNTRGQKPSDQISVKKKDRLRVVSMPTEATTEE